MNPEARLIAHVDLVHHERTESLAEHLHSVSGYARQFGTRFGCPTLAELAAKCHDCGKAAPDVQAYLWSAAGECDEEDETAQPDARRRRGPDHSSAGAQFLDRDASIRGIGTLLAYAVAGHHAGMPDGNNGLPSDLKNRLRKNLPDWKTALRRELPDAEFRCDPSAIGVEMLPFVREGDGYSLAFLARMLFSCLVDADFLATEKFMDDVRAKTRESLADQKFASLKERLDTYLEALSAKVAANGMALSAVNGIREEVRADCCKAAALAPGLFTLTVPTGGGKTLSSMAFALRHAAEYHLDRVVYVIPYTSIIEQNAQVFRSVFGDDAVLEHHGSADFESQDPRLRLLAENWDAPIVVTTSVQFFESLHSNRASACRKLHNLAKSVVILDEAQSLPIDLLRPCLRSLDELVQHYGTSIVLCTATQPAVLAGQLAKGGLTGGAEGCREIVPADRNLHERLRRVTAKRIGGRISDETLLSEVEAYPAALVIVNTRRHARDLFEVARKRCTARPVFHLSAQMCPRHRVEILNVVKGLLRFGKPCLLVSTQLIEAGVDIDFPCVFREMAGADSLAQAAGRCNREGRLPELGHVFFFESSEYLPPPGFLRRAAEKGKEVLSLQAFADDLLVPEAVTRYFELLYKDQEQSLDRLSVLTDLIPPAMPTDRNDFLVYKFRTLGESFRLISEPSTSVFVPYGDEGRALCEKLRGSYAIGEQREIVRKLRRFSVGLRTPNPSNRDGNPIAELVHDTYWVLTSPETNYDEDLGIVFADKNEFLSL